MSLHRTAAACIASTSRTIPSRISSTLPTISRLPISARPSVSVLPFLLPQPAHPYSQAHAARPAPALAQKVHQQKEAEKASKNPLAKPGTKRASGKKKKSSAPPPPRNEEIPTPFVRVLDRKTGILSDPEPLEQVLARIDREKEFVQLVRLEPAVVRVVQLSAEEQLACQAAAEWPKWDEIPMPQVQVLNPETGELSPPQPTTDLLGRLDKTKEYVRLVSTQPAVVEIQPVVAPVFLAHGLAQQILREKAAEAAAQKAFRNPLVKPGTRPSAPGDQKDKSGPPPRNEEIPTPFVRVVDRKTAALSEPKSLWQVLATIDRKTEFLQLLRLEPAVVKVVPLSVEEQLACRAAMQWPEWDEIPMPQVQVLDPETGELSPPEPTEDLLDRLDKRKEYVRLVSTQPGIVKVITIKEDKEAQKIRKAQRKAARAKDKSEKEFVISWGAAPADLQHKIDKIREALEEKRRVTIALSTKPNTPPPTDQHRALVERKIWEAVKGLAVESREAERKKRHTLLSFKPKGSDAEPKDSDADEHIAGWET